MSTRLARVLLWIAMAVGAALPARAGDPVRELHGMADTFAVSGVALAWGVVRGASEAQTVVVLRVVTNPAEFPAIAATGTDPFTQRVVALPVAMLAPGRAELRVPRAQFADVPRTDLRFYASSPPQASDTPKLVVYYLGVPDTTPEFATEAALDASLDERLQRVRGAPAAKTP